MTSTLAEYAYLGVGGIVKTKYVEPDVTCDFTYQGTGGDPLGGCLDRFGRVVRIPWIKSGTPIAGATYEYDRSSNRTQMQPLGYTATDALQRYSYDGVDRLTCLIHGATNEMQGQETWSLDATGNWRQYEVLDVDDASKNLAQTRQANRANEITDLARQYGPNWPTPQYDRAGNTVTFPQPLAPTAGFTATYDAWNRLITLTKDGESDPTAVYAYDGLTRRTTTTDAAANVRHCYYAAGWQAIEERLNAAPTADRQFTWGLRYIDDQICRDRDTNADGTLDERLYALQDANWNTVAVTNASGTIQQRYRYTAYGQPTRLNPDGTPAIGTDTIQWDHLYCAYRYEHAVGVFVVRFRYLESTVGLWLSHDPLEYQFGLSFYEYCHSNPLLFIDPTGLRTCQTLIIVGHTREALSRATTIKKRIEDEIAKWEREGKVGPHPTCGFAFGALSCHSDKVNALASEYSNLVGWEDPSIPGFPSSPAWLSYDAALKKLGEALQAARNQAKTKCMRECCDLVRIIISCTPDIANHAKSVGAKCSQRETVKCNRRNGDGTGPVRDEGGREF